MNNFNKQTDWLTIGEAADILQVSRDTLRRWEKKGKIKSYRSPSNRRMYKRSEITGTYQETETAEIPEAPAQATVQPVVNTTVIQPQVEAPNLQSMQHPTPGSTSAMNTQVVPGAPVATAPVTAGTPTQSPLVSSQSAQSQPSMQTSQSQPEEGLSSTQSSQIPQTKAPAASSPRPINPMAPTKPIPSVPTQPVRPTPRSSQPGSAPTATYTPSPTAPQPMINPMAPAASTSSPAQVKTQPQAAEFVSSETPKTQAQVSAQPSYSVQNQAPISAPKPITSPQTYQPIQTAPRPITPPPVSSSSTLAAAVGQSQFTAPKPVNPAKTSTKQVNNMDIKPLSQRQAERRAMIGEDDEQEEEGDSLKALKIVTGVLITILIILGIAIFAIIFTSYS